MLILEENDLEDFVKEEVIEPDEEEAKYKYKKNNQVNNMYCNI
jgi:hypothetical protein